MLFPPLPQKRLFSTAAAVTFLHVPAGAQFQKFSPLLQQWCSLSLLQELSFFGNFSTAAAVMFLHTPTGAQISLGKFYAAAAVMFPQAPSGAQFNWKIFSTATEVTFPPAPTGALFRVPLITFLVYLCLHSSSVHCPVLTLCLWFVVLLSVLIKVLVIFIHPASSFGSSLQFTLWQ